MQKIGLYNSKVKYRIVRNSDEEVAEENTKRFRVDRSVNLGIYGLFFWDHWQVAGYVESYYEAVSKIKEEKANIEKAFRYYKNRKVVEIIK